jgi:hypothetical protein
MTNKINPKQIDDALYINSNPTTSEFGGIPAGSNFFNTAKDFAQTIDAACYPYIHPTFTNFALIGISNLEVGTKITDVQTFTWAISDPTHVATNSVNIYDTTNILTLVSSHSVTSPATYDFDNYTGFGLNPLLPGLEYDVPTTNTWKISATDIGTPPAGFLGYEYINWYWLLHYGTSTNTSLTETQIKALVGSILTPTTARTYNFAAGGYKYICVNEDLPQPTSFKDSSTLLDIPFEAAVTVSVTNVNSIISNYKVYRSTNSMGAAIGIIVA